MNHVMRLGLSQSEDESNVKMNVAQASGIYGGGDGGGSNQVS